ncbi:hypothetical protein [Methylobacterium sp. ID0610]|uniref:COG3904 family protein n=1 Tax=Methylobacterium carpenticola TaxID=3344827 RepID=UPI00367BF241
MGLSEWTGRAGGLPFGTLCVALGAGCHTALGADGAASDAGLAVESAAGLLLAGAFALALTALLRSLRPARRPRALAAALTLGLAAGLGLATAVYPSLSPALAARLGPADTTPDTLIALGPGGGDVRLSGTLTPGAAERLDALLAENPQVTRLHLTSDGGLVDEGTAIGAVVAAHRLVTYVPDYCISACTLAFLRGRERVLMAEARLGFHSPYETGLFGETIEVDSTPERRAYLAAGLSPDFVDAVLRVRAKDLWSPPPERLRAAGAITEVVGSDRMPDSTLDDDPTLAGARAAVIRAVDLMRDVAEHAPDRLDAVAAAYLESYRQGRSEAHGLDVIRTDAARALAAILAGAPDAVVVDLGRLLAAAMEAAGPDEAGDCIAIGREADLAGAAEILGRRDPRAPARARALVARALSGRGGPATDPPAHPRGLPGLTRHAGCRGLRDALGHALAEPDAAPRLRALLFPGIRPARTLEATALPPEP